MTHDNSQMPLAERSSRDHTILLRIIIIKNKCHSNIMSIDFKVAATAKSCGKLKVSHVAVKSFDRRGVSCKNARYNTDGQLAL